MWEAGASWALGATVAGGLALTLWGEARDDRRRQFVGKPLASVAVIALAWTQGALDSPYGQLVLVALALSLVGDVLLIPKDARVFRAGIVAFLLAHLVYVAAFVAAGIDARYALAAAAVLVVPAVLVGRAILPRAERPLRAAVVAYIVVISVMAAAAVGTRAFPLVLAAGLFYASDLTVARHRFVRRQFANRLVGLPLYYAAQVLFAVSVAW